MKRLGRKPWPIHAAALLAVALLSFASVQSIVMQAVGGGSASMGMAMGPDCPMMGGAATAPQTAPKSPADRTIPAPCAFCAVAGQAPLASTPVALRAPVAVVWSPRPISATLGPRGPPRFRARARGPPSILQTV